MSHFLHDFRRFSRALRPGDKNIYECRKCRAHVVTPWRRPCDPDIHPDVAFCPVRDPVKVKIHYQGSDSYVVSDENAPARSHSVLGEIVLRNDNRRLHRDECWVYLVGFPFDVHVAMTDKTFDSLIARVRAREEGG